MNTKVFNILMLSTLLLGFLQPKAGMADIPVEPGIHLISEDETGLTLQITLGDYQIEKVTRDGSVFDQIETDGGKIGEPGKPNLPMLVANLGVLADVEFSIQVISQTQEAYSRKVLIEPAGSYKAAEEDFSPGELTYILDEETYSSYTPFPGRPAELGDAYWMRDQRILPVRFFPFQYVPAQQSLSVLRSIIVRVDFHRPMETGKKKFTQIEPGQKSPVSNSSPFETVLQKSLVNYESAKSYRAKEPSSERVVHSSNLLTEQSSHPKYKITVTNDGIYRITYETLQAAGMPVDTINPSTFSMSNQGRPVAIYVDDSGNDPDRFQPGEFILFYGEHFDGTYLASLYADEANQWRDKFITPSNTLVYWSPQFNKIMLEKYTDLNVYWLSYDGAGGPFMSIQSVPPNGGTVPGSFREVIRAEEDLVWRTSHFTSEDTFFWERVRTSSEVTRTYTITLSAPFNGGADAILRGELVGYAHSFSVNPDHRQRIYFNRTAYPDPIADISWDGLIRYEFNFALPASKLVDGTNLVDVNFIKQSGMVTEDVLVNWYSLEYDREYIAQDNQLIFAGDQAGTWNYQISGFSGDKPWLLDITQSLTPTLLTDGDYSGGILSFEITHAQNSKFIAANPLDITVVNIQPYSPAVDLNDPADYLIITPPDFLTASQALADYRQTHDGLIARVVNVEDLYNEYNYGIFHPIAIKNYLKVVYHAWAIPPTYVLLVGDGHWNFLGSPLYDNMPVYMPPNLQWVDPWQGEVDSSSLLAAVNGDDPIPDILIGRLPVNSSSQIDAYIQKVILHESQLNESWQKKQIFIADAPDPFAGDFPALSQAIIDQYLSAVQNPKWVYLDTNLTSYDTQTSTDIPCVIDGNRKCINATNEIISLLNTQGGGLVNYTGHGAINIWTKNAQLFIYGDISSLNNSNRLPIILSWTCLDGYWIYPKLTIDYQSKTGQSIIEEMLRLQNNGIVGAFSPTGLGVSTGHDYLQRGFYDYIFSQQTPWRLGQAALAGKMRLYSESPRDVDLVHTYTVFGDPALLTTPPEVEVFLPLIMK